MKLFHQAVKASNSSKSRNSKSDGSSGGNKTDGPAATTPSPEENDTTKESNKIIAALRELSEDSPVEADSGCPVNVEQLGTATWTLLHTIAAYFPDEPSEADRRKAAAFIESLAYLYPCEVCAEDFRESVKRHPPRYS
jgi:FAD-linked sulfhydryl oxidase